MGKRMADKFLGAWRVSEYVYNPDGTYAGIVHQRRELEQLDNGRIRVTQHCMPNDDLADHPMGNFKGTPVFELSVNGRMRRYHGPSVIGTGIAWGEGTMTGRGLWPKFEHNFRSFALLATPERQLTGGQFFKATEMIANIVGVAVPEAELEENEWPQLGGGYWPTPMDWEGSIKEILPDGTIHSEKTLLRHYDLHEAENTFYIEETIGDQDRFSTKVVVKENHVQVQNDRQQGLGKTFGAMMQAELTSDLGLDLELMELLDMQAGHLVGLRKWFQDGQLEKIEVMKLTPKEE